jgi:hypothetical protein
MSYHDADPNQALDFSNFEPKSSFDKKPAEKEFACRYCGYKFNTESAMMSHELRRHEENVPNHEFKCKVCGDVFYHTNALRVHNYTHSTLPLLFCEYSGCSQFFNRSKLLKNHISNVHKAQTVSCETCKKKLRSRGALAKHLKNNRCIPYQVRKVQSGKTVLLGVPKAKNKTVDQLQEEADIAKEQFRAMGGVLKDNPSRAKKKKKIPKSIEEQPFSDHGELNSDEEIKAEIESDKFFQNSKVKSDPDEPLPMVRIEIKVEPQEEEQKNFILQDHSIFVYDHYESQKVQKIEDDLNPIVVLEKLDSQTLLKWQKPKKIKAESESFEKVSRLHRLYKDIYMERIEQKKKTTLTCDECGEVFNNKALLKEHVYGHNYKHGTDYFCDLCDAEFFFKRSLQHHKRDVHCEKINFICDLCGNKYYSYPSITYHLTIVHMKIADFRCPICPSKSFKTRANLNRHDRLVHQKIMRFQCNICGKFFQTKEQVKVHEKCHNDPVPCHICGKLVRNLNNHVKQVHETDRKAQQSCCVECGKMVKSYNIQFHIDRIHRKLPIPGKIYPCVQCSETFSRSDDLRR